MLMLSLAKWQPAASSSSLVRPMLPPLAWVCPPRRPCWGELPPLDVHLIGRGAILHLTLAGGACGEEKHRGTGVTGERTPGAGAASAPCPPGDGFMLALSLATPRPTPSSHQPSVPFLVGGATSQGSRSPLLVLTPLSFPSNGTCSCHFALNPLTSNYSPSTSHKAVPTSNCQPSGSILFRLVSRGATSQQEESGRGFQPVALPTVGCPPACTQEPGGVARAGDGGGRGRVSGRGAFRAMFLPLTLKAGARQGLPRMPRVQTGAAAVLHLQQNRALAPI